MRARAAVVLVVAALGVAGCSGSQQAAPPKPAPKIPRTLAQSWAQQADQVAAAIDAGDGCTAQQRAVTLRTQVVDAVNAHQVPRRYLEPLVSTTNDLAGRIACTPQGPPDKHDKHDKKPARHGKHGDH
jgi:hypothetical protein